MLIGTETVKSCSQVHPVSDRSASGTPSECATQVGLSPPVSVLELSRRLKKEEDFRGRLKKCL